MKTRLIFVRHAEAQGNIKREFHGWTDEGITDKGHRQAELVAEKLNTTNIDILYSSSMIRTIETAEYISKVKNLPIIRTDKLKEINGGEWEGKRWDSLPILYPDEYNVWENTPHLLKMPNGESIEEFYERLIKEIKHIINENEGKNICIVTHGTAIRVLMCAFKDIKLENLSKISWVDNTSITVVDFEENSFEMITEGDDSHLSKEDCTIKNQEWYTEYINKLDSINGKEE